MLVAIAVILTGWALQATRAFIVPVVFSIFLALLVAPLDRTVAGTVPEKLHWFAHVVAMGAILVSLLIFMGLIWISAQQVVDRFPLAHDGGLLLPQFGEEVRGVTAAEGTAEPAATTTSGPGAPPEAASAASDGQAAWRSGLIDGFGQVFSGAGGSLIEKFRD